MRLTGWLALMPVKENHTSMLLCALGRPLVPAGAAGSARSNARLRSQAEWNACTTRGQDPCKGKQLSVSHV